MEKEKKAKLNDYLIDEMLQMNNIIKTENGFALQKSFYKKGDTITPYIKLTEKNQHSCPLCSHYTQLDNGGYCDIYNKLLNLPKNHFALTGLVYYCEAYFEINTMNIIKSMDEMITFIENTANFFGCPEDYEAYYGFQRKWDETTGEILETVREYYDRGGTFTNIPTQFPSVIRFDLDVNNDLEYIYIGDINS